MISILSIRPAVAIAALLALVPLGAASAYTLKTLHSFCAFDNCGDGEEPVAGLLRDALGNLYGTTPAGGANGHGVVFKLARNIQTGKYKAYVLHNFCKQANCTDGSNPQTDLILDKDGNLYGTTENGGAHNDAGVAFKLTHGTNGWSFSKLHDFCGINLGAACADGKFPVAGFVYAGQASGNPWDESSPLFGTAIAGGQRGRGVAFKLVNSGGQWQESIIHDFSSAQAPLGLIMDTGGNLFGMTVGGGKYDHGLVYKLKAGTWDITTLHNFCADANCPDGDYPVGKLAMDAAGDIFGMTERGGDTGHGEFTYGVVFERKVSGSYSVIHTFGSNNADGIRPESGPVLDSSGNVYGAAYEGGIKNGELGGGTIFRLSYDSSAQQWNEEILHTFSGLTDDPHGLLPEGPVIIDANGNLYGTTLAGGANGNAGTVFELTP